LENPKTKPQDCYLRNIKSETTGPAAVSGWLKRKAAARSDAFAESAKKPTDAAKRR
jgi:hypothetical protein